MLKIGQFEPKNMFTLFHRTSGVVNISYLDKGKTKDYQTYIEVWLKPLVSTFKEQRSLNGSKNLKFYHLTLDHMWQKILTARLLHYIHIYVLTA